MENTETDYFEFLLSLTGDELFSKKTAAELFESDNDPKVFYKKHKKQFAERAIEEPGYEDQTLCYLLDILIENNYAYELDWKTDIDSLNHALETMSGETITEFVNEDDEAKTEAMFELIDIAEDRLEEKGYALIEFPLDSDSHPISLVAKEKEEKLNVMIDRLFGGE